MTDQKDPDSIFGARPDVIISVGEYFDFSDAALGALVDGRYYECAAVCAVMVDVIVNDILDNIPSDEVGDSVRRKTVGAIIKTLAKRYKNPRETEILQDIDLLNKMRIRVVHPGSESWKTRIRPDKCPRDFAQQFFDQLERVVDSIGGYSNRQFGEDFQAFVRSRRGTSDPT